MSNDLLTLETQQELAHEAQPATDPEDFRTDSVEKYLSFEEEYGHASMSEPNHLYYED